MSKLKSAMSMPVQGWMTAPETAAVLSALGQGNALFVGGCVRNMVAGEEIGDIDIATTLPPGEATSRLEAAGIKVVPTGIDHGTVTAVSGGKPFEITTLRRDVETDGRRAVVAYTEDWAEDARRRDFTINTLLADAAGNVYDPTGTGVDDLIAGRVIFVGDPATRIAEDHLRILRFFRFHARYGRSAPDEAGLAACRAAAGKIATLSAERVTQEFFRILSVDAPADTLDLMFENGILKGFEFPEYDPALLRHLCMFQSRYGLIFLASRLLAVAGLRSENIQLIEKILLIPKVFKKDIEAISQVLSMPAMDKVQTVREAIYRHGRVPAAQALMIELAQDRVMNGYAPSALEIIQKWDIPDFPLGGEDLKAAGIPPGPEMGRILSEIEDWWIAGGFTADKKACLERLRRV